MCRWGCKVSRGSCTHRARTVRSFDIFIVTGSVSPPLQLRFIMSLSWVTPGTDVFYNRASTGDRVPAIVLGSSPQPGDFLRIQYEVGGKVVVHEAAALHRIEFQIRSPSPSPSLSPPQRHEQPQPEAPVEPNEDPPFQPENVDPGQQPQPEAPVEGGAPQPPPKRASKTSAQARERQKERRQAAKSVKIDISDEDWQENVDWLLRRRQETSGKNQYVSAAEYFLKRWELLPGVPAGANRGRIRDTWTYENH